MSPEKCNKAHNYVTAFNYLGNFMGEPQYYGMTGIQAKNKFNRDVESIKRECSNAQIGLQDSIGDSQIQKGNAIFRKIRKRYTNAD